MAVPPFWVCYPQPLPWHYIPTSLYDLCPQYRGSGWDLTVFMNRGTQNATWAWIYKFLIF